MWMLLLHLLLWAFVGAAILGYLGVILQIVTVGIIASGFILSALFVS